MTPEQFPILLEQDLIPTVYNHEVLFALEAFSQLFTKKIKIHIKVDTGMGRLGFSPEDARRFCPAIALSWKLMDCSRISHVPIFLMMLIRKTN